MLPTIVKSNRQNDDLLKVTYVLNRWQRLLDSYGVLDQRAINKDFSLLAKIIRNADVKSSVKNAICKCRDYALTWEDSKTQLSKAIKYALEILCDILEDKDVRVVKQQCADQGMTERYRPLSRRLEREKIRKLGKEIYYTDAETDDIKTTKLVRRIVEKRAAQAAYRHLGGNTRKDNKFRQSVRRAVSFNLFNVAFTEYSPKKRENGTHWSVVYGKFGKKLRKKKSYTTYEEAVNACNRYMMCHPDDHRSMSAYHCASCGKWHIGHERQVADNQQEMLAVG